MPLRTSENLRSVDRHHVKKTKDQTSYEDLAQLFIDLTELLRPPERITVTEAVEKYVYLNNPGAYIGKYKSEKAPYMQEPMDTLASREFSACVFVGPAQSSKTESLILGFIAYSVTIDPMDMMVFSPTQSTARDFSTRRVDRMHRNSPDIGKLLLKDSDSDNKFDKHYRSGMILNLSWPTVAEFAGRPVGRIALTDYDRMKDDIDGDGNPFDLASKRTTTFGSFAMTLAESSPSRMVKDPKWIRATPHEAPPCDGILGLYNRGDRRRWFWPCPHCGAYFESQWSMLKWETKKTIFASAETATMTCPTKGCDITHLECVKVQTMGVWLREGQSIDENGNIVGDAVRSSTASFWLNGTVAAFTTWRNLVSTFLTASEQREKTGSEEELKKFFNTDLGVPYIPKKAEIERLPEVLKSMAERFPYVEVDEPERVERAVSKRHAALVPQVPPGVRFLVGCVDVQANMFVVQVHGISPGEPFDVCVIDRFSIRKSRRQDHQGDHLWVKPNTYAEDWDEITTEVLKRTYELSDGSGRRMMVRYTVCDSAGQAGATTNAYNYQRKLRIEGLAGRFHLVKGDGVASRPTTMITFPDSNQRDKLAAARGDVPVMLLNSNLLKDNLIGRLDSTETGTGRFTFPDWLPDWWFSEMCAEVRTDKGWVATSKYRRNEGFDLSYYVIGACLSKMLNATSINWSKAPGWAAPWDTNDLVVEAAEKVAFAKPVTSSYDFAALGQALG